MSVKERERLKIISTLADGHGRRGGMTQQQAAELLGCTERHVRRLAERYRLEGDAGLVHKSRGRPSNRRFSDEFREEVMSLVGEHYSDFGPTLAAEKLQERHGLTLSCETLRNWMIAEQIWKPKQRKAKHLRWRERKACLGEMVQIDTSDHDWFESRGPKPHLINLIDDATSRQFLRFYASDSRETNMAHLREYIRRFGRPRAFYGDKASHFRTNRPATVDEQTEGLEPETQIERALRELDITYITAHSPQAKGRVERSFNTAQDRLIKEMRLDGICDIETANDFLEEYYMPLVNKRFSVSPACAVNAHRTADDFDLDAVFSRQETRVVMRDYTIQFENERYQIRKRSAAAGMVGSKVIVEQRLDGSRHLRWRDQYLAFKKIEAPTPAATAAAPALGLRPRSGAAAERPDPPKPKPDHPWRNSLKGASRSQRQ